MGWLRRFVRRRGHAKQWTMWSMPALVLLRFRPDPSSATRVRALRPDWPASLKTRGLRDPVSRRPLP
jgi:nicotinate-nucleotide adenylyltransferase